MKKKDSQVKVKCKNCGQCCLVWDWLNDHYEPCKYLIRYVDGTTRCMIYPHRIGAIIGYRQRCIQREKLPFNIPGCPYNKPGQEIHDAYR
jgi:uncharacterized cysteine cluster protein YcgN (CxxCxxCC family)